MFSRCFPKFKQYLSHKMRKKIKKSKAFSSFCRLCLSITEQLIDITSEEFDFDIIDLIFETLDIKFFKQNPVFSNQFVCTECLDIAQFIKKFKQGCKTSLETLTKCVIQEVPKDMSEMCWTGDRKRLKDLMLEVSTVHEDSLVVQSEHYKELYNLSIENKEQLNVVADVGISIEKLQVQEKVEVVEIKSEIKEEEVNDESFDFDVVYTENDENSDKSVQEKIEEDEVQSNMQKGRKHYKKYQCEICMKYFDGYDFKYHMNTHLKVFPFRCDEEKCDRKFTSPSNLASHRKAAHVGKVEVAPENLIPCDRCGLSFTRKQLYTHFKRDHGKIKSLPFSILSVLLFLFQFNIFNSRREI